MSQLPLFIDEGATGSLLDALPGPVLVVGADARVAAANGPAQALLPGLRPGDPLALSLRDPSVLDAIGRVAQSGQGETVEWRDRVPVERSFEVTALPLGTGEDAHAVVLSLRDRTEARRIERMRADFIANASHELRTPLASLLGFIETLQGPAREDAAARERFLAIMGDQARRMARLVDDLLSLSRIEQSLHLRPNTAVDLGLVARHVADTLAPLADERGATVTIEAEPHVIVAGDRDELVRVAENLIENAIKYGCGGSPAADRVVVTVRADGHSGVLAVRDHGAGIAARHIPRLTERFYRVDAGQSRAKGGTGLGLALVKHVLARHRGRLTIDSTPGQGATFTARLPLAPKGMTAPPGTTPAA